MATFTLDQLKNPGTDPTQRDLIGNAIINSLQKNAVTANAKDKALDPNNNNFGDFVSNFGGNIDTLRTRFSQYLNGTLDPAHSQAFKDYLGSVQSDLIGGGANTTAVQRSSVDPNVPTTIPVNPPPTPGSVPIPGYVAPGANTNLSTSATPGSQPSTPSNAPMVVNLPNPPAETPVTTGVPTANPGTPVLPPQTSTTITDSYYASLATQVTNLQTQLDTQRQTQLDQINANKTAAQAGVDTASANEDTAIKAAQTAKLEQINLEEQRFNDNYKVVQGLASQLTDLMTQGNALIAQEKGVTGLASIRDPRVAQTISSITAATGVIQAAISVYSGQMNQAQSQLQTATSAITSAYQDQIDYYKSLQSFYESGVTTATKDKQDFMDTTVKLLQNRIDTANQNSDALQNEFLDPTKALAFAQAGITINTPQSQWGPLLAKQAYSVELSKEAENRANDGYTQLFAGTAPKGSTVVTVEDSKGINHTWYKIPTATTSTGTVTERQQAALQSYSTAFVPGAKLSDGTPVIDNNGYVTPVAWKQAIVDYKGDRADFIKKYGYLLYKDKDGVIASNYGLTAQEAKLITG